MPLAKIAVLVIGRGGVARVPCVRCEAFVGPLTLSSLFTSGAKFVS